MSKLEQLALRLRSLVIFRSLLEDPVLKGLSAMLSALDRPEKEQIDAYADFVSRLFDRQTNLTQYLESAVLESDTIYVRRLAQGLPVPDTLRQSVDNELDTLQALSQLTAGQVRDDMAYTGYLPAWEVSAGDLQARYLARMQNLHTVGYGLFSRHPMFVLSESGIVPVLLPDPIRLSDLKQYQLQRDAVKRNTQALLRAKPAANALLYGDAGTGKSSTVKALVNEFFHEGLRLIEVRKRQFDRIPALMESLSRNPLKFIVFIDDLSFASDNDDYNALKAVLEGSVSARTSNTVIYATSNRRHLVRESFSDRAGDDIHLNETIQELSSLSERFGLAVAFMEPDQENYLRIVRQLKAQFAIDIGDEELEKLALQFAFARSGRSPRVARQFIESLLSRPG